MNLLEYHEDLDNYLFDNYYLYHLVMDIFFNDLPKINLFLRFKIRFQLLIVSIKAFFIVIFGLFGRMINGKRK